MKELVYETVVDKKVDFIFQNIYKKNVYKIWGKAFSDSAIVEYEGELHRGSEISFIDDDGNKLVGIVSNYVENQLIEFSYKTMDMNGKTMQIDDGMNETYAFEEILPHSTLVTVVLDMPDEMVEDINNMWEKGIISIKNTLEDLII